MASDYLYRNHFLFDRDTINIVTGETYNMVPPYRRIYLAYLFPSGIPSCVKVPVGLVHGKENYSSIADLELRPWIELNNDQGVTKLSDQRFSYAIGDLTFHIFVDPQDRRKAVSPHFRHWQGNVLVVHEANHTVINAFNDDMAFVQEAVDSVLAAQKNSDSQ